MSSIFNRSLIFNTIKSFSVYSILQSGNKAEYLKLMTENTGALATVLKELFHDHSYDSWNNYEDNINEINEDTIKNHG